MNGKHRTGKWERKNWPGIQSTDWSRENTEWLRNRLDFLKCTVTATRWILVPLHIPSKCTFPGTIGLQDPTFSFIANARSWAIYVRRSNICASGYSGNDTIIASDRGIQALLLVSERTDLCALLKPIPYCGSCSISCYPRSLITSAKSTLPH